MRSCHREVFMYSLSGGILLFLSILLTITLQLGLFDGPVEYYGQGKNAANVFMGFINMILYFYSISKLIRGYLDYKLFLVGSKNS